MTTSAVSLSSTVLQLTALESIPAAAKSGAPHFWGRAMQAAFLQAIRQVDPTLAKALHPKTGGNALKPYTATDLWGWPRAATLPVGGTAYVRFTASSAAVCRALEMAVSQGGLQPNTGLMAADYALRIVDVAADPVWSSSTTYEDLSAKWLLNSDNPTSYIQLRLTSPTRFKQHGGYALFPTPTLVFSSLLHKWNAVSPVTIPAELLTIVKEAVVVSYYDLHSVQVQLKGPLRPASKGDVRYLVTTKDAYWRNCLQLLAEFGFYAGLGANSTTGLGQCRVMPPRNRG